MSSSYLPMTDAVYQYMLKHCTDADEPVLNELRAETQRLGEVSEMANRFPLYAWRREPVTTAV